eukprot:GHVS01105781.1.p1 GENE.GHVS01105781.1~~GHVS01105781.1.p1  ORF type:complete len:143 (-),score=35.24 GHVS01105781.1:6-434(-)
MYKLAGCVVVPARGPLCCVTQEDEEAPHFCLWDCYVKQKFVGAVSANVFLARSWFHMKSFTSETLVVSIHEGLTFVLSVGNHALVSCQLGFFANTAYLLSSRGGRRRTGRSGGGGGGGGGRRRHCGNSFSKIERKKKINQFS